jgi:hypothetical protein
MHAATATPSSEIKKKFFKLKGFRAHAVCCYPGTGVTFVAL